ncbi:MAG: division/cell wall cluster transcriptional repressor MraZ [Clostridiales bacterium]|nr:division/cell wall cluster transcriptional repressor MraZ [Clostridiales bacterium]MCR4594612.1 division/cell wall cluster transcriptional repressor MraZ [Clostridiales bacterium]
MASFFFKEFHNKLDAKNRVFIPARYRDQLSEGNEEFIIFKGPEKCLYVYDRETFEMISEQFKNSKDRVAQRSFFSQAVDVQPDKQGRVTLSVDQLEHAGIDKELVIVGAGQRFEIWAAEEYDGAIVPMDKLTGLNDFIF